MIEGIAIGIALTSLVVSAVLGRRSIILARHANSVTTLVDLFREHRSDYLASAREFAYTELHQYDISSGLEGLPPEKRKMVRDLAAYYNNLGALVAHGVVDIAPVSGFLGGSVLTVWEKLSPIIDVERARRSSFHDPHGWQRYFENLYLLLREQRPEQALRKQHLWRASREVPSVFAPIGDRSGRFLGRLWAVKGRRGLTNDDQ